MMVVRFEDLAIWVELVIWLCVVFNGRWWGWGVEEAVELGRGDGGVEAVRGEGGAGRKDGGGS